jgi:hypothetical protein
VPDEDDPEEGQALAPALPQLPTESEDDASFEEGYIT